MAGREQRGLGALGAALVDRVRRSRAGRGEGAARLRALEARVEHLEAELRGLEDSVHREAERRDAALAELNEKVKPAAIAQALSADARERGI